MTAAVGIKHERQTAVIMATDGLHIAQNGERVCRSRELVAEREGERERAKRAEQVKQHARFVCVS